MCTFSQPVQVSEAAKAKFPAAAVAVALILGNLAASCHAFSEFSGIRAWYAATFRFGMMGGYILILGLVAYVALMQYERARSVAWSLMIGGGMAFLGSIFFALFLKLAA